MTARGAASTNTRILARWRGVLLAAACASALAGCSSPAVTRITDGFSDGFSNVTAFARRDRDGGLAATPAGPRADVNSSTRLGDVDIPVVDTPSLEQIIAKAPIKKDDGEKETDKLRAPAMRDAALSYGARAGLAWTSRGINEQLRSRSAELTKTYDFNRVLIRTQSQASILPPVISEAKETYETADAGKTLRVADTVYEIVEQARFVPIAPLWHSYLVRSYTAPENPPDTLLPKTDGERDAWKRWVTEGWNMGIKQAQEIFDADLRRLERDFVGMVRYKALLEEGKVSAPVVAEGNLGVTGNGTDMRVNDRALRITKDPLLQTPTKGWQASPSPLTESNRLDPPTSQSEPAADNSVRKGNGWRRY
ncbi:defect-in-organelle-trafficking protein DotC [Bradyrhizobium sp. USDA 4341]